MRSADWNKRSSHYFAHAFSFSFSIIIPLYRPQPRRHVGVQLAAAAHSPRPGGLGDRDGENDDVELPDQQPRVRRVAATRAVPTRASPAHHPPPVSLRISCVQLLMKKPLCCIFTFLSGTTYVLRVRVMGTTGMWGPYSAPSVRTRPPIAARPVLAH